jgi:hypothetical protein
VEESERERATLLQLFNRIKSWHWIYNLHLPTFITRRINLSLSLFCVLLFLLLSHRNLSIFSAAGPKVLILKIFGRAHTAEVVNYFYRLLTTLRAFHVSMHGRSQFPSLCCACRNWDRIIYMLGVMCVRRSFLCVSGWEMTRWQSGGRLSQFQPVIDGVIRQTTEQRSR